VLSYDTHRQRCESHASTDSAESLSGGKAPSNLVVLLTELYNFQVVSCVLMYGIIRELLDGELGEMEVELLLKIMRSKSCSIGQ
jgi:nucleolar MIF4G domain-containing protein 1